jgi:hypothetical protein
MDRNGLSDIYNALRIDGISTSVKTIEGQVKAKEN